jgi:hypothetical protein
LKMNTNRALRTKKSERPNLDSLRLPRSFRKQPRADQ